MTPREAIKKRQAQLNLTDYQLAQKVKGEVSQSAVYRYLRGGQGGDKLIACLMAALDMRFAYKWSSESMFVTEIV